MIQRFHLYITCVIVNFQLDERKDYLGDRLLSMPTGIVLIMLIEVGGMSTWGSSIPKTGILDGIKKMVR